MAGKDKVHGEGNYAATKDYNERTKKFVESGEVKDAAKEAAPHSREEARRMTEAENAGKKRTKAEDPGLYDPEHIREKPGDTPKK